MKDMWCKKEFLTEEDEVSTSSICSYAGMTKWREDLPPFPNYLIEVADCHGKVRLHRTAEMSAQEWIDQVIKLQKHITDYLQYLST